MGSLPAGVSGIVSNQFLDEYWDRFYMENCDTGATGEGCSGATGEVGYISFLFDVVVDNTNLPSPSTIHLPIFNYCQVSTNWGDNTINSCVEHTYMESALYNVLVYDIIEPTTNTFAFSQMVGDFSTYQHDLLYCDVTVNVSSMNAAFFNCSNLSSISDTLPQNVVDMASCFENCVQFDQDVSGWIVANVKDMSYMFANASSFRGKGLETWNTSQVTTMAYMFSNDSSNANLSTNLSQWPFGNITDMSHMFQNCVRFDTDVTTWNVGNVSNMDSMFRNASSFQGNGVDTWNIGNVTSMLNMLDFTDVDVVTYNSILTSWAEYESIESNVSFGVSSLVYNNTGLVGRSTLSTLYGWRFYGDIYNPDIPCFHQDTKILTERGYVPVKDVRVGDRVQTVKDGFKPITYIGFETIFNSGSPKRFIQQLYIYPGHDLILTGNHSALVKRFQPGEPEKTIEVLGKILKIDGYYRLPAYADQRSKPYPVKGSFDVYHFSLESPNIYQCYGVYANGMLVESSCEHHVKTFLRYAS